MSTRYSFRPLKIDAGGTVSAIALNAAGTTLVVGGDVEGIFRSEDRGDHWRVASRGLHTDFLHRVACIVWSKTDANTVYAGVGNPGSTVGGFLASTDGGKSWSRRSNAVQFAGNHTAAPLPDGHPRSTGNLIAEGGGYLYVATYDGGVFRSNDGGFNWTNIGFSGDTNYCRSIAIDAADPNTLYVALYNDRVWKTSNAAGGTPSWTQLTNAPTTVEELVFVGTYLYAAARSSGLYRSTDAGATWDSLNGAFIDTSQSLWRAIDGYVSGTDHVIIAGCANGVIPGSDGKRSIVKLTISGGGSTTYADLSSTSAAINRSIAPDNRSWWHGTSSYQSWLGGSDYQPTYILVDPNNTSTIWATGTDGVFRSEDAGATWQAAFNGMPLTLHRRVVVDPTDPLHLYTTADDWTLFEVTDGVAEDDTTTATHAPSSAGVGYGLAVDSVDNRAFLAVGERDTNTQGEIFSRADVVGATWINEGLSSVGTLSTVAADSFSRTVSNGWGTADTGGAWTLVSGNAADFSVSGGVGRLQLPSGSGSRSQFLTGVAVQDCTGKVDVIWHTAPTGASHFTQVYVRSNSTTTRGYTFRIEQNPGSSIATIRLHKFADGGAVQVGGTTTLTYNAGDLLTIRFNATGTNPTTLNMKAWTGGPDYEPVDWMINATDSEALLQTAGSVGIRASGSAGYTAASLFTYDNFEVNSVIAGSGDPADKRPIGITVGRDASNNRVVLTAVDTSGLWRKVNGSWAKVSTVACSGAQTSRHASIVWEPGSQYVYVLDRASGLYRSSDYGVSWSQLWSVTSDSNHTGFIAQDPNTPNELWVSLGSGLYRLSNIQTGTSVGGDIPSTLISDVLRAGPLAISSDGTVWCIDRPTTGVAARLLQSADNGTTWIDVSDEAFRAQANRPTEIAIAPNGRIYISTTGNGVLLGYSIGQQQTA